MNTTSLSSGLSALVAVLAIGSPPAHAQSGLAAATSLVNCTANDGTSVGGSTFCAVDSSLASITTLPYATLTADASYAGGAPASSGGFAVLNYSFAVVGGTKDTVVPVDIGAVLRQMTVNADKSGAYGFSEIVINTPRSSKSLAICTDGCGDSATSFDGVFQVDALAGETSGNTITLEIEALAGGYATIPSNSAFASADPRIYVDPGAANAGAYSIVLSDGIGNGIAAVPEPGALASMLAGLALTGWRVRRQRSQAPA